MPRYPRRSFLSALLAMGGLAVVARGPAADGPPLRFGVTPVILDEQVGVLQRWAAWLAAGLGRPVELLQRTRYREIVDLLLRGQVDLAWLCGLPYVQQQDRLTLVAVPCWHGQPLYRAEIVVSASAPYHSLEDLQGRLFAWSDPDSNSGWLWPRYRLLKAGQDPDRFFRRTIFTWGHARSIRAVAEGLVDGASVDGYVRETLLLHRPALAAAVRVIEHSPWLGFPPLVGGPALATGERARLAALLGRQHEDATGRALLTELNLDGFVATTPALFADIAAMAAAAPSP